MDSLFKEIGKKIEAPTNFHLSLEEKGKVYFLEKGSMILFASQKQGRRTLLSTVGSGRLLFTIEKDEKVPYEIFAFSEEKVTLWEVDRQQLASSLKSSSSHQSTFSSLLEHWLNQFSHFLFSPMEVSPKHWIKKGGELEVEKGEIFTLKISEVPSEKERVFWMTPKEGEYKLLGPHEYKFSKDHKYFPILPHLYFLSLGKGDYDVTSTAESVKEENWGEGLSQFHRFIGHYLIQKRHFLDEEELKRFEEKELLQEETLHETLSEMASLLERKEVDDGAIASQPLNQAIEIVFKNIGLKLQSQKKWDGELKDQIAKAAEKSGARARVVLLGPLWWKFDSGPLLAFYGTEHHPVALIKNRWGHYEMIDPLKKTRKRVTAKIARLIAKDGYTFYQAIPDEIRKGGEALRFFLRVNKKEFWKLGVYGFIAALFSLFPPIAMAFIFNNAIPNANVTLLIQIILIENIKVT